MARVSEEQTGPRRNNAGARASVYLDAATEDLMAQARIAGLDFNVSKAACKGIRAEIRRAARRGLTKPTATPAQAAAARAAILGPEKAPA